MLLKNLTKISPKKIANLKIKGLAVNRKKVKKGFIFFAIKGSKFNGENYIKEAIRNGATLIVCSTKSKFESNKVEIIKTSKISECLLEITSKFYKKKPPEIS